jgi:acetolactate synthase-1/2/3 large subunit
VNAKTGGTVLIDALVRNGADHAFLVPGESYLEALDAFYDVRDSLRPIVCRQEGGAAYMAEAYGKVTGRPGICFVTRGPGATNASIAIHTAKQDSTPMILFVGQVETGFRDREAFQEISIDLVFGSLAKWAAQIDDADRVPEYVARAFRTATGGRPGPVVLGLPEDMLAAPTSADAVVASPATAPQPAEASIRALRDMLERSRRPMAILGGSGWTLEARNELAAFLEAWEIPTACGFRRQDRIDNRSRVYAGYAGVGIMPYLAKRISNADLILAIGTRLSEAVTQGYELLSVPRPRQRLVHLHVDQDELGRVYQADLAINSTIGEFARAVRALRPAAGVPWSDWLEAVRSEYERSRSIDGREAAAREGFVDLADVVAYLDRTLPDDAVITTGAGNFAGWVHRYYRYRSYPTALGAVNGSMGYGLPSAIAAKLVHPQRIVVAFCGDGDFLMTGQELATAMQHHVPIVVLVANNGMYGTIRMHQERDHPERVVGTDLQNPDFVRLGEAFGAHSERVARSEDFPAAFARALAAGRPALLELAVDPELLSTRATVSSLRERAAARRPLGVSA